MSSLSRRSDGCLAEIFNVKVHLFGEFLPSKTLSEERVSRPHLDYISTVATVTDSSDVLGLF